jgi:hypothetical protein
MRDAPGTETSGREDFEYDSLDPESRSIRLLQIIPAGDSKEQIQCMLRLGSTVEQYTCLSYVWGDPEKGQWILVNGRRLWVRQNLHSFLDSARKMPELTCPGYWIWIDAICIDQNNITEREHQVQQMGRIYAGAEEVISWLGMNWKIAAMLITYPGKNNSLTQLNAYRDSPYWDRAWITQEIVLARSLKLMVCDSIMDISALPEPPSLRFLHDSTYQKTVYRIGALRKHYHKFKQSKPLVELLDDFTAQECFITRDRVFSLLALCDNCKDVKVNYTCSDAELAIQIMRSCSDTFCLCALNIVGDVLYMPTEAELALKGVTDQTGMGVVRLPMAWSTSESGWSEEVVGKTCGKFHWVNACSDSSASGVLLYKPSLKTLGLAMLSLTINMHELCATYCGRVVFRMYRGRSGCSFQYFGACAPLEWEFERSSGSIALRVVDGTQSCEVALNLELWLQIARGAKRHTPGGHRRCCGRVEGEHVNEGKSSLRLCAQDVGEVRAKSSN